MREDRIRDALSERESTAAARDGGVRFDAASTLRTLLEVPPETALAELSLLRERIIEADRRKRPLCLVGGDTKAFYGEPATGEPLDLRRFRGVVSYEPTELVVTARAGTRLSDLQALLAEHGQMLAFEPPSFGLASTIGGVFAAGLSGPRRASAGSLRDFVLGAGLLAASGEVQYFGGQVMKNVAGYDVARALAGSLGILGVVTEMSFKVLPLPAAERSVRMRITGTDAVVQLNRWAGQPMPVSGSVWQLPDDDDGPAAALDGRSEGLLTVRLSGARAAVDAAVTRLCDQSAAEQLHADDAAAFWAALRDQRAPFFAGDEPLWRVSLPSTAPFDAMVEVNGARQLIEWGGALRWLRTAADAAIVRMAAERVGGTATLFRGGRRTDPNGGVSAVAGPSVFHPLPAVNLKIHRGLKQAFDPNGIFNPGRLYRGL